MTPAPRSLKLEDVKELQAMVAQQLETVERGLRVVDTGVVLGSVAIDVLGQDASGRLALLAIGFTADDQMMLRALDAYSLCLDDPDALGRRYPKVHLSRAEPPRMMFIAEQVPDAFRRKIKHLRFNRVDCFEFRLGLQFNLVEEIRGTHDPGAATPAAPTAEPRPTPRGAEPVATPRGPAPARSEAAPRVDGRRRPELAAAPASSPGQPMAESAQWGRKGGKPAGHVDEEKVRKVREYLQHEFPTLVIYDFYSHDLSMQTFHLQDSHGAVIHSAAFAEDLLAERSEVPLPAFLGEHKLARLLREAGAACVSVTRAGLTIEQR